MPPTIGKQKISIMKAKIYKIIEICNKIPLD